MLVFKAVKKVDLTTTIRDVHWMGDFLWDLMIFDRVQS
jgi:hypothetical protein